MYIDLREIACGLQKTFRVESYHLDNHRPVTGLAFLPKTDPSGMLRQDADCLYLCEYRDLQKLEPEVNQAPFLCIMDPKVQVDPVYFFSRQAVVVYHGSVRTVLLELSRIMYECGGTSSGILVVSSLTDVFSGTSDTAAQLAMTFMCLCIVLTALCSGAISRIIGRRFMCAGGMALTAAGGLIGIFLTYRLWVVFLSSAVLGIGTGLFVPTVSSMMIDYLSDEEREKAAGVQTAFVNLGGMLLSLLSGLAAAVCWNYAYAVYLLALPVIFLALRSIPAEEPKPAKREKGRASFRSGSKIPAVVWSSALQTFLFAILYFAFSTNISLLLEERRLGGADAAGLATGIFMLGGLVFGLLFSRMYPKLGAQMPGLAFFILSVSYLMVYASGNLIGILIAGFFGGGSLSVIFPYFLLHIAGRVDPSVSVISSSLILSVGPNPGSFVSPMILTTLAGFMGDTAGSRFMLACAAALILTIVTLVFSNDEGCSNTASVRT